MSKVAFCCFLFILFYCIVVHSRRSSRSFFLPLPSDTGVVTLSVAESDVGDRTKQREAANVAPASPPAAGISGYGDGLGPRPRVTVSTDVLFLIMRRHEVSFEVFFSILLKTSYFLFSYFMYPFA